MAPRTVQEILEHADELARRFEDYEPKDGDELVGAEIELRRAVIEQARGERAVSEAVAGARRAGVPWARIGAMLGTSAQAAQQRYG